MLYTIMIVLGMGLVLPIRHNYISFTTNSLETSLKQHFYNGSITKHHELVHKYKLSYNIARRDTKYKKKKIKINY